VLTPLGTILGSLYDVCMCVYVCRVCVMYNYVMCRCVCDMHVVHFYIDVGVCVMCYGVCLCVCACVSV